MTRRLVVTCPVEGCESKLNLESPNDEYIYPNFPKEENSIETTEHCNSRMKHEIKIYWTKESAGGVVVTPRS